MTDNKPCKHAEMGCDGWECADHQKIKCDKQVYDYNPDGKINVVLCCEVKEQEE